MDIIQENHKCPYCQCELDIVPKRKKKCPHCGGFIFVRNGRLITEDDANIEDWLVRLAQFRITKAEFDSNRQNLSKQFGSLASINDTVWRILNEEVLKRRSFHDVEMAYYEMARLASTEDKDPKPFCAEALRTQLTELKTQGVKIVKIVGYGMRNDSSCRKCRSLHGKKFDIEVALRELPIPTVCEDELGCKCSYVRAD